MSRKRKTKQEKMIAELRRKVELSRMSFPEIITQPVQPPKVEPSTDIAFPPRREKMFLTKDYSYVIQDTKKTFLITSVLLFLNIATFILLQKI